MISPLVKKKHAFNWEVIFETLKSQLENRTLAALNLRWNGFLNPNLDFSEIREAEEAEIIADFDEHGFNFEKFRTRTRSTSVLRRYMPRHVIDLHQKGTNEMICSFLFRKLEDLSKTGNITVKQWIEHCNNDKKTHRSVHIYCIRSITITKKYVWKFAAQRPGDY